MARSYPVNPSEEVIRQEIAVDIVLISNKYAVELNDMDEPTAAYAVARIGKHLAQKILEERCSTYGLPPSSP